MMKAVKILWLYLGIIAPIIQAYAQSTIYSYNNACRIELPSKLELQDSELNSVKRVSGHGQTQQVNINTLAGHITFQQKGLNAGVQSAYSKYCRVIIEYFKESRQAPTFGDGDKIVITNDVIYEVHRVAKESCIASHTPLIKIISVQSMSINGYPVLYYSYKRKGLEGKRPPVIVNVYRIFNRYESVTLTFSYREAERGNWIDINNQIMKTFRFIKKY